MGGKTHVHGYALFAYAWEAGLLEETLEVEPISAFDSWWTKTLPSWRRRGRPEDVGVKGRERERESLGDARGKGSSVCVQIGEDVLLDCNQNKQRMGQVPYHVRSDAGD